MRYRELIESQGGAVFYHVTTNTRLKSIMATGLQPTGHHRRWKNTFGRALGDRGYLYLISDFSQAVRWAAKQDYYYRAEGKATKVIILVLHNVPLDTIERDPNIEGQMAGNTWFRTRDAVPPADIVRVIPLTPEMIKQVVNGGTVEMPSEETPADEADASV